jgi:hypothetical protein
MRTPESRKAAGGGLRSNTLLAEERGVNGSVETAAVAVNADRRRTPTTGVQVAVGLLRSQIEQLRSQLQPVEFAAVVDILALSLERDRGSAGESALVFDLCEAAARRV